MLVWVGDSDVSLVAEVGWQPPPIQGPTLFFVAVSILLLFWGAFHLYINSTLAVLSFCVSFFEGVVLAQLATKLHHRRAPVSSFGTDG